jgi:hypothetical protein
MRQVLLRVEVERDLAVSDLMEVATPPPPLLPY